MQWTLISRLSTELGRGGGGGGGGYGSLVPRCQRPWLRSFRKNRTVPM